MLLANLCGAALGGEPLLSSGVMITLRLSGVPAEEAGSVTGNYVISDTGKLSLPHLKSEISAAGLRATELSTKIAAAYKAAEIYTNPNITVTASGSQIGGDLVVTVGGEVRTPRTVAFRPGLDLYGAITEAGGPSEWGDMRRVKLIRNKTERVIDLRKVTADNSIELMVGDSIIVPGS